MWEVGEGSVLQILGESKISLRTRIIPKLFWHHQYIFEQTLRRRDTAAVPELQLSTLSPSACDRTPIKAPVYRLPRYFR